MLLGTVVLRDSFFDVAGVSFVVCPIIYLLVGIYQLLS
jgi:hypothetical protein